MSLKIGIVGLPNVGKSTLFNALTQTRSADAQNYPFCTIDPNVGIVEVPDKRLDALSKISNSEKVIPATIEFVDIAGLVKGASQGEGLGNKFLSHIRECHAIGHVLRMFDDENIIHVHGKIDPKADREVIESELILADLQTVEKRLLKAKGEAKSGNKEKQAYFEFLQTIEKALNEGKLISNLDLTEDQKADLKDLHLLTLKPHLYIINVPEDQISEVSAEKIAAELGVDNIDKIIPVSAKLEEELGELSSEDAEEYLAELGIEDSGLSHLIRSAYKTLNLITYFTSGPKESRAWTIKNGYLAPQAAGVIHTDFETGFIKAEVIAFNDYETAGSEQAAKEKGLMRMEGKEYEVKDGDVILFKFAN
jgi:GTP-binding protein YchF